MKKLFLLSVLAAVLWSCARVGSPIGGERDSLAPRVLGTSIDTPRVLVPRDLKELRIDFDEYITLKEINKNLIISPPIRKITRIMPSNLATRHILIQWEDTLQANTTYSFNFGSSIQDNNEGNVLPYYNFAFSTGEKIDDYYISGEVTEGAQIRASGAKINKVVGLYQYKDSMDYRQKPYYITRVDDDGYYELNYLSPGTYKIVAFEDENGNSVFDPGKEKIAFRKDSVVVEQSVSGIPLQLYPSQKALRYTEMKENPGGVLMLFEGNPDQVEVSAVSEKLKNYKVTHRQKSDSVHIWFDAVSQNIGTESTENLKFSYDTGQKQDTVSVFYKRNKDTEMTLANQKGNLLPPKTELEIVSNFMIDRIQPEKWTLTIDSTTAIPLSARISETNPYKIFVKGEFEEGKSYQLTIPSKTVSSFYESTANPYRFDFEADQIQNYGSFTVRLKNQPPGKFWLQLLDASENIMYQRYTDESELKFPMMKPGEYFVRLLADPNGNRHWDVASLQQETFAEDAFVFFKKVTIRPLWELVEDWDFQDPRKLDLLKPETSAPQSPQTSPQRNQQQNNPLQQNRGGAVQGSSRTLQVRP